MTDIKSSASSEEDNCVYNDEETQNTRAFLREKFLRLISKISNGKECTINMYDNITVQAQLRAFDSSFQNIAVKDLQTPYLPIENAILRTSDVISLHLSNVPIDSLMN